MDNRVLKNFVLPLIVFPTLTTLAITYIFAHAEHSGLVGELKNQCLPQAGPGQASYRLEYTGLPLLDARLCPLITFFHTTMANPAAYQQLFYFVTTSSILVVLPGIEASRANRSLLMAFPAVWLMLGQVATVALAMTIYWLVFFFTISPTPSTNKEDKKIGQAHAEALIFGVLIGLAIPSVAMLYLKHPQATAIWQIYPIFISLAEGVYLLFRRPSTLSGSGHPTIQVLLLGCFIVSSIFHLSVIWPIKSNVAALKALFIPSVHLLDPSTPLSLRTVNLMKWDLAFGFGSTIAATSWFAKTPRQLFNIFAWYAVMIPLVGPSAAVTGVAMWRESKLQ